MSLYEVLLRRADGTVELRVTDHPLEAGATVEIGGRRWLVDALEPTIRGAARYVCRETGGVTLREGEPVSDGGADPGQDRPQASP